MIIPNIWKNKKCFKPPTRGSLTVFSLWLSLRQSSSSESCSEAPTSVHKNCQKWLSPKLAEQGTFGSEVFSNGVQRTLNFRTCAWTTWKQVAYFFGQSAVQTICLGPLSSARIPRMYIMAGFKDLCWSSDNVHLQSTCMWFPLHVDSANPVHKSRISID